MHVHLSIAKTRVDQPIRPVDQRSLVARRVSDLDVAVRQFFRPQVLMLLTLAIIWAGFIYGYKLSQYQRHPEVTKASLARAWVDHRHDSIGTVTRQQIRPAKLLALVLVTTAALRMARRTPDLILDEPAFAREAFLFSSLIPFRAPPSHPSLA